MLPVIPHIRHQSVRRLASGKFSIIGSTVSTLKSMQSKLIRRHYTIKPFSNPFTPFRSLSAQPFHFPLMRGKTVFFMIGESVQSAGKQKQIGDWLIFDAFICLENTQMSCTFVIKIRSTYFKNGHWEIIHNTLPREEAHKCWLRSKEQANPSCQIILLPQFPPLASRKLIKEDCKQQAEPWCRLHNQV